MAHKGDCETEAKDDGYSQCTCGETERIRQRLVAEMSNIGMEQHEPPVFEYQDNNDADGPSFWWRNPWNGQREKIASLFWPAHPPEATDKVEHIFENLCLSYEPQ